MVPRRTFRLTSRTATNPLNSFVSPSVVMMYSSGTGICPATLADAGFQSTVPPSHCLNSDIYSSLSTVLPTLNALSRPLSEVGESVAGVSGNGLAIYCHLAPAGFVKRVQSWVQGGEVDTLAARRCFSDHVRPMGTITHAWDHEAYDVPPTMLSFIDASTSRQARHDRCHLRRHHRLGSRRSRH